MDDNRIGGLGRVLVWLLLLAIAAGLVAFGLMALLNLVAAAVLGEPGGIFLNLLFIAICVGALGFMVWLYVNARRESGRLRRKEPPEPRADGDMSDVAGIPERDPWLG